MVPGPLPRWEFCTLHFSRVRRRATQRSTQTVTALERFRSAPSVQAKCLAAVQKCKNLDRHSFWAVIHSHQKMDW